MKPHKAYPLIDPKPYYFVCAGVRKHYASESDATVAAEHELREWRMLGYMRTACVYYRDGSLVAELSGSSRLEDGTRAAIRFPQRGRR